MGRFEAMVRVPTGGWAIDMEDDLGTFTADISAGDYYLSGPSPATSPNDLPGLLDAWRDACTNDTPTAHPGWNFAAGADGRVTVTKSGTTVAVTWGAGGADMKRVMGFDANVTASGQVGAKQMESLWLPPCPVQTLNYQIASNTDEFRGWLEHDFKGVENMSGLTAGFTSKSGYVRSFIFPQCRRERVWMAHESIANESFERFAFGALLGRFPWSIPGGPVRWWHNQTFGSSQPDATDAGSQYKIVLGKEFAPMPVQAQWNGLWRVEMNRCLLIPSVFV